MGIIVMLLWTYVTQHTLSGVQWPWDRKSVYGRLKRSGQTGRWSGYTEVTWRTFIHGCSRIHGHLSNTPPLELKLWGANARLLWWMLSIAWARRRDRTEIVTEMNMSLKKAKPDRVWRRHKQDMWHGVRRRVERKGGGESIQGSGGRWNSSG
jgi:hypothetical protein